jgi:hypothetical protein
MGDDEGKSPDEDLVARLQRRLVDPGIIHVGPIGRPAVLDDETVVIRDESAVLT